MRLVSTLALSLTLVIAAPLRAETVQVELGGARIALTLPAGHCLLERSNQADRGVIETVERVVASSNRVLAAFAHCEQRAEFRAGSRTVLDDYGQYMTPLRAQQMNMAPDEFARQMTELFKKQGAQLMQGAEADTRERIGALRLGIRMGENRMLGVLRTDERASYIGLVQSLGLPDGTAKLQVGVAGFGLIKTRVVSLNVYARFEEGAAGASTTLRVLDTVTQTYAETAAANAR
jgi:hypothetical protein